MTNKTKEKRLTTQAKETLFKVNIELLKVLHYIGGDIMLKEHLMSLTSYFYPLKTNLRGGIKELIEAGFLKEQQFITSNKYFVYMTKYPIAKLEGVQSRNANSISPSFEKMANSLFRMEYLITITLPKLSRQNVTIEQVKKIHFDNCYTGFIPKSNPEVAYQSFNTKMKFLEVGTSNFFRDDYKTAIYEKEVLISRISNEKITPNKEYKETKKQIEKLKSIRTTPSEKLRDFFNFKNLLSRNFLINGIQYQNKQLIINLSLFDLNDSLEIIYLYKNLGYIYQMFDRYLILPANVELKVNLSVYTWSLNRSNVLRHESTQRARDFGTGGFKKDNKATYALLESGLQENRLKHLKVDFKSFNFDKKYGLVK